MKLSIIIVNYNASHFINQTINSILKSNLNIEYEIVIVDNNSYDDSVELIKGEYPNLKIILNDKNLGFSKAVNIGVNTSLGDYDNAFYYKFKNFPIIFYSWFLLLNIY